MDDTTSICASCGRETTTLTLCEHCDGEVLLDGRYRLAEIVGRGAAGTTYRAIRVRDDAVFAVKELDFRRIDSFKTQTLFEREAAVLEQLGHPGIPQYVDNFTVGDGKHLAFCLVQEFIEGNTLAQEAEKTRYDEREALELLDELLEIATYLHNRQPPVIHRDIKPKNVMRRSADDSLVIIDFGSVREVLDDPEAGGSTIAGTFGFMAPEQFQGVALPATDVYGLGALTVALLSRKRPQQMLDLTNRLDWESHVNVSSATRELLRGMLEPVHHERISNAAAARDELSHAFDVLDGRVPAPVEAPALQEAPDSGPTASYDSNASLNATGQAPDRRKLRRVAVAAAAVTLLAVVGAMLQVSSTAPTTPESSARGHGGTSSSWKDGLSTVDQRPLGTVGRLRLSMSASDVKQMADAPPEVEGGYQ